MLEAGQLDGAAGSLREGLAETLTVNRLGIRGSLKRTLVSTNPCQSMIECARRTSRNVKRWSSGELALRWTAAGMLEAERQFRRVIGYRDLTKLSVATERDIAGDAITSPTREEAATLITVGPPREVHDKRDILVNCGRAVRFSQPSNQEVPCLSISCASAIRLRRGRG